MRILIVEDLEDLALSIKEELKPTYAVDICTTGKDGSYQARTNEYDLIILDIQLPDISGIQVCSEIRSDGIATPILMLTGESEIESKVIALDTGADDYLTKPFKFEELTARIRALMRRTQDTMTTNRITVEDLTLDTALRTVNRGNKAIKLRRKEFDLLEYMMRNAGKVLTRSMILEHVWDNNVDFFTNAIDVHIKYLRDQVDRPFKKKLIKTVHGLGYKLQGT
jgi:DNA-binding response OmpR family regulator